MAVKTIKAEYKGYDTRAVIKSGMCELYVNGKIVSRFKEKLDSECPEPIMRTVLEISKVNQENLEVYAISGWRSKAKICIDGRRIAGDDF